MPKGPKRSTRANQPATAAGPGVHYTSPIKARGRRRKGVVKGLGQSQEAAAAAQLLYAFMRDDDPPDAPPPLPDQPMDLVDGSDAPDVNMDGWIDEEPAVEPPAPSIPRPPPPPPLPRQPAGDAAHQRLNEAWNTLLPSLELPWLVCHCTMMSPCNDSVVSRVKCLYPTHVQRVTIRTCSCKSAAVLLVEHGVFPASPTKPQTGVSFDLLDSYRAFFERSCDAVTALAAALHTVYERRGFRVLSDRPRNGEADVTRDPFRRSLIQAVQYSCNLRAQVEAKVDAALLQASSMQMAVEPSADTSAEPVAPSATPAAEPVAPLATPAAEPVAPLATSTASTSADTSAEPVARSNGSRLLPGRADRALSEHCPACFGLTEWGRSLADGGDVQNGADGCFSYPHAKKAGDGPISYKPQFFLSKKTVDSIGQRIIVARTKPKANPKRRVPQEVIDSCEESWDAANEKKRRANPERYDASGVFVMTCRHGQVILLCNIDTPGEQQRYIVAMLETLFKMLPWNATLIQAYDVACITDHSLNLYPILSEGIRDRVAFVINGMHAYGHQWACQLVYSPRFRVGMGLSDHEGVERFWSRMRKLIPVTRAQWGSRRIWMIDQYAAFVGEESRASLGAWIGRQQEKNVVPKHRTAAKTIRDCGLTESVLRAEWDAQKEAQTSIRAHAPQRLRRELDKVLSLQTQIEAIEKTIEDTNKTLKGAGASTSSLKILQGLEVTHEKLSAEAEALYASLNIQDTYPELRGLPLEFTQTLLVARDLKINIRKRATGSFMEWETLDRAVSGRREPLGTRLHQITRKAISKRQPALLKAINKFNTACATLESLRPPQCSVPIPTPLSTQLNGLRNDPSLHEDVWITPSEGPIPRWLNDTDVRDGIRSLHLLDRCAEETVRLNLERDNLKHWLREEKDIVARAKEALGASPLVFFLSQREQDLADMSRYWAPFLRHRDVEGRIITTSANALAASAVAFADFVTPSVTPPPASITPPPASAIPPPSLMTRPFATPSNVASIPARPPTDTLLGMLSKASAAASAIISASNEDEFLEFTEDLDEPQLDPGDLSDEDQVVLIEQVMEDSGDEGEVETSAVEVSPDVIDIQWTQEARFRLTDLQLPRTADTTFARQLADRNADRISSSENLSHFVVRQDTYALEITPHDFRPFANPTGRLNGAFANQCAVFSTYDLPKVHFKRSDPDIWRHISPTKYWDKPIWLIPIFRAEEAHWVLAIVLIPTQTLLFFDSLASARGWRQDLRDVMLLMTRLVALANRNSHPLHVSTEDPTDRWQARPLFKVGFPRQTNDYDCGVWVLSMMAAFMRGHQETALTESNVPYVRDLLKRHILTLSIT
ncbi:hypothetical protein R3P38DRAFT_3330946 [Favolaschia claudopus]|uniref:Ubiquitin-like protease family profile domain-containing protein n=1 Tax=Favolaschia claudopus TaxID=2862362 RepID=A0AAV9ZUF1_9AGAR